MSDSRASFWGDAWPSKTTLLLGVGAMKAGTSWLHDYLASHSDVHFSQVKEVHYFDVLESPRERHHLNAKIAKLDSCVQGLKETSLKDLPSSVQKIENALPTLQIYKNSSGQHEEYRDFLLQGYKSQKVVGDITPSYCALPQACFAEMNALAPSVKFVFVMRDAIDRLWSAVRMGAKEKGGDFTAICNAIAQDVIGKSRHPMLSRSDYESTIRALEAAVPKHNVLILFYETMFSQAIRNKICDFLEIAHESGLDNKLVRVGTPSDIPQMIRTEFYKILKPQYDYVYARFDASVPDVWYRP
jgi:hypothetical protein